MTRPLLAVALLLSACGGPSPSPAEITETTAPLRGEPGEACPALFAGGCSATGESLACGSDIYRDGGLVWQIWSGNPLNCQPDRQ